MFNVLEISISRGLPLLRGCRWGMGRWQSLEAKLWTVTPGGALLALGQACLSAPCRAQGSPPQRITRPQMSLVPK